MNQHFTITDVKTKEETLQVTGSIQSPDGETSAFTLDFAEPAVVSKAICAILKWFCEKI